MEQLSLLEQSRLEEPEVTDDRAHVRRLADRMLRELDAEPPIDLGMVASYQGVAAVRRCELPNGGCLVTDPSTGAVEIRLRSSDHPRRQRFSGFHEVTHTFMPGYHLQVQWRCDPHHAAPAKPQVEVLCDVGASELILPRRLVVADLAGADFGLQTVFDVAERYDASLHATAHRVVDLWPEDLLFVVAQVGYKPADASDPLAVPVLRVASSWASGAWPFIRKYKSVAEGDPLTRALQGELVDEVTKLSGISAQPVDGVYVSARLCPFTDAQGVRHDRVLALYRRARVRHL
jgi:hypothetical protein